MKITVINGTEKQGITWRLKEFFLEPFREEAEITEFSLPKDCPSFCNGCISCILHGEQTCKDSSYIRPVKDALMQADLIVMTSPAYNMHASGAMKALLDHLACLWIPHRPASEMFGKRAVIITQCIGAGAKSTAKDIRDSLSWWGISDIEVFTDRLMESIFWSELSEKKKQKLIRKIRNFSDRCHQKDFSKPARTGLMIKIRFFCGSENETVPV